jgi:hypothetical protein
VRHTWANSDLRQGGSSYFLDDLRTEAARISTRAEDCEGSQKACRVAVSGSAYVIL